MIVARHRVDTHSHPDTHERTLRKPHTTPRYAIAAPLTMNDCMLRTRTRADDNISFTWRYPCFEVRILPWN